MAHMSNHVVVEVWQSKNKPDVTYHVTKNDRVLRVIKKRLAAAKILHFSQQLKDQGLSGFNFSGVGMRVSAAEWREQLAKLAVRV